MTRFAIAAIALLMPALLVGCSERATQQRDVAAKQPLSPEVFSSAMEAAKKGDLKQLEALFKECPDLIKQSDKKKLLQYGAYDYPNNVIEFLISAGLDINATDNDGSTPLHSAAFWGRTKMAALLIGKGANVCARNKYGSTPLNAVAEHGSLKLATLLIDSEPETEDKKKNLTATLFGAATWGRADLTALLISRGADVNTTGDEGKMPLHLAVFFAGEHPCKALCVFTELDEEGRRDQIFLLGSEPYYGYTKTVKSLLDGGAKKNATDAYGNTPLHAVKVKEIAEMLIAAGADVNARDNEGNTPLAIALKNNRKEIADVLLKHGAKE